MKREDLLEKIQNIIRKFIETLTYFFNELKKNGPIWLESGRDRISRGWRGLKKRVTGQFYDQYEDSGTGGDSDYRAGAEGKSPEDSIVRHRRSERRARGTRQKSSSGRKKEQNRPEKLRSPSDRRDPEKTRPRGAGGNPEEARPGKSSGKGRENDKYRSGSKASESTRSQNGRRSSARTGRERVVQDILSTWLRRGAIALAVIFVLAISSAVYSKLIRGKTWLSHTSVNGIDVSGKTMEETLDLLPDGRDYQLTIHARNNGEMKISAANIDYHIDVDEEALNQYFKQQHKAIIFPWASYSYTTGLEDGYDEEELISCLDHSELILGSEDYEITEPVSADIVYSEEEKGPVVKKEVYGNALNKEEFHKAIKEAIEEGLTEIDLDDKEKYPSVYKAPAYTADSKEIEQGLKDYRSYISRYISWEVWEGEKYTISPRQIRPIVYFKDGKMSYRVYKLEKLIQKFCDKYQTAGKTRQFTTHTGKTVTVKKGDYGWKLDFNKTLDQAETALTQELDEEAVNRYIKDHSEANKEAVTISLKPQYKTEAFCQDYDNYQDWDPDNYTEASIEEQMIYVHRDGKIVFSCKTISGLPVEGRETAKGVYYVKGRSPDRVLRGEGYETPVKYWIRLTTTGTGFHAAPWQKWDKWSPTWYKKHGSHGCLNLSEKDAKKMYEIIKQGEAVFIY